MSFPKKRKNEVPLKWKKVFILHKVIIEIAKEVETSFPEVGKRYLLGRRLFFNSENIYIIGAVDSCGKSKHSSKENSKMVGDYVTCHFPRNGNMKFP